MHQSINIKKKPPWLVTAAPQPEVLNRMNRILEQGKLSTVCEWADCPNIGECFGRGTATFLILGRTCTRGCTFCPLAKGQPAEIDVSEPENIARTIGQLKLNHVVITSVSRDDLPDGGATHFARTITEIKKACHGTSIEVLIPDFKGCPKAIETVASAGPDIIGHNLETVPRLYGKVRPGASHILSLEVLGRVKQIDKRIWTKSGIMLGLGEKEEEILQVLYDLRQVHCDFLTLGQYLQPTDEYYTVVEYVPPEKFQHWHHIALQLGFKRVLSCPLGRSSYRAEEMLAGLKY